MKREEEQRKQAAAEEEEERKKQAAEGERKRQIREVEEEALERARLRMQAVEEQQRKEEEEQQRDLLDAMPLAIRMPQGGGRKGFVYDGQMAVNIIAKLLEMRDHHIHAGGRFVEWREDFQLEQPAEFQAIQQRAKGAEHRITRELRSRFRTACQQEFGGVEWHNIIIAIGQLDDLIMDCLNTAQQQRLQLVKDKKQANGHLGGR